MPTILCLHASGSSKHQWRSLQADLCNDYRLLTPQLLGYGGEPFDRRRRLSLDDEVDNVLRQVGPVDAPLHVVGHSYGGGVALRLAQRYPSRVLSLTLYEPAQPLVLFEDGLHTAEAREMRRLRNVFLEHATSVFSGWRAARESVTYWSGPRAWSSLRLSAKRRLAALTPKIAAEWDALFSSSAALGDAADLAMPVHLVCGSATRRTAKRVCERLLERLPNARLVLVPGARHMAPATHPQLVNPVIADCVAAPVTLRCDVA